MGDRGWGDGGSGWSSLAGEESPQLGPSGGLLQRREQRFGLRAADERPTEARQLAVDDIEGTESVEQQRGGGQQAGSGEISHKALERRVGGTH